MTTCVECETEVPFLYGRRRLGDRASLCSACFADKHGEFKPSTELKVRVSAHGTEPLHCMSGTGKEGLLELASDAIKALDQLVESMRQAYPHLRDYQGDKETWLRDSEEHYARVRIARELKERYIADMQHLAEWD